MLIYEDKLRGTKTPYAALDEAIRTTQFLRNKALRLWMDGRGVTRNDLHALPPQDGVHPHAAPAAAGAQEHAPTAQTEENHVQRHRAQHNQYPPQPPQAVEELYESQAVPGENAPEGISAA